MKIFLFVALLAPAVSAVAQTDTTTFRAEEVAFWNQTDSVKLAGTLTIPNDPTQKRFPAAVVISGSGPEDRDGVSPALKNGPKTYKALAEYLSARGFAVLRYDDRGTGASTLGKNPAQATGENFARDARAALDFLKTHPAIDNRRVGIVGHSEGATLAPRLASRSGDVAFVVALAGTGVDGGEVMIRQNRLVLRSQGFDSTHVETYVREFYTPWVRQVQTANDTASLRRSVQAGLARLKATFDAETLKKFGFVSPAVEKQVVAQLVAIGHLPWMREFMTHDPAPDWQATRCPVLTLNGSRDVQVDADQNLPAIAAALKRGGNRKFQTEKVPGLNHLFQQAKTGAVMEYFTLKQHFAPDALKLIAGWLRQTVH